MSIPDAFFQQDYSIYQAEGAADMTSDVIRPEESTARTDEVTDEDQLTVGAQEATDATEEVTDGTEEVTDGTEEVTDGTEEVTDGTEEVTDGTEEVTDGTEEVTDGTEEEDTESPGETTEDECADEVDNAPPTPSNNAVVVPLSVGLANAAPTGGVWTSDERMTAAVTGSVRSISGPERAALGYPDFTNSNQYNVMAQEAARKLSAGLQSASSGVPQISAVSGMAMADLLRTGSAASSRLSMGAVPVQSAVPVNSTTSSMTSAMTSAMGSAMGSSAVKVIDMPQQQQTTTYVSHAALKPAVTNATSVAPVHMPQVQHHQVQHQVQHHQQHMSSQVYPTSSVTQHIRSPATVGSATTLSATPTTTMSNVGTMVGQAAVQHMSRPIHSTVAQSSPSMHMTTSVHPVTATLPASITPSVLPATQVWQQQQPMTYRQPLAASLYSQVMSTEVHRMSPVTQPAAYARTAMASPSTMASPATMPARPMAPTAFMMETPTVATQFPASSMVSAAGGTARSIGEARMVAGLPANFSTASHASVTGVMDAGAMMSQSAVPTGLEGEDMKSRKSSHHTKSRTVAKRAGCGCAC